MFNSNINCTGGIGWDLKDLKSSLTNHFKTIQEGNAAQYKATDSVKCLYRNSAPPTIICVGVMTLYS